MGNELARTQTNNCTLYEIEDTLAAFVSTIDLAPDDATRLLVLDEIGQALRKAKEKRDGVVAFLRHCEEQQEFADAEIERIERRKELIARVQAELERHVVQVIEQFAAPDRRGIRRLEGNLSGLRIQKNPDSVVITDPVAIPLAQKDVTLTMPAYVWEALLQVVGTEDRKEFESHVQRLEYKPDKKAIAADLKNGVAVLGADLKFGDWRLVIG
jgi:Siphovirus Gp157